MSKESERERSEEEIEASVNRVKAEAGLHRSEGEKFLQEARKAGAEADKAASEATLFEMELAKKLHSRAVDLADDDYHNVYRFTGAVAGDTVKKCTQQLTVWNRMDPGSDIKIIFNSPGGGVIEGMALWDHLQYLKGEGHNITTGTQGMAASMAGILLQAGNTRVMGAEAWLLIHEASYAAMGSHGEVEDTVEWIKKIQERILDIFAERSTLSKAQIKKRWTRKDWWISSTEALKFGFCDEVR